MNGRHVLLCAVLLLWACTWPAAAHTVIEGPSGTVAAGSTATLLLGIGDVTGIEGVAINLTWDPEQFTVTAIAPTDIAPALRTVSLIRNDAGWAMVVVTCPGGITVATDTCEPILAVTVAAGDSACTAPVGFAMAMYSNGFLPTFFARATEGVIIITAGDQTVPAPDAAFSATPVTGTAPLTVDFSDKSTGSPDRRAWIFGDGGTSNMKNPVHVYTTPGTYTVSLLVGDGVTSSRETKQEYIVVTEAGSAAPDAAFSATPVIGTAPLTVDFSDQSTGSPDRWAWIFGDGGTSNMKNPVHVYTAPGTYTVTLMVGDGFTNDRITREAYIRVDAPVTAGIPPVSRFSVGNPTPVVGENVQFIGIASDPDGTIMSWSWDFGDGILSNKRYLAHAFAESGIYTVTLTVTDDDALTDASSIDITVR